MINGKRLFKLVSFIESFVQSVIILSFHLSATASSKVCHPPSAEQMAAAVNVNFALSIYFAIEFLN